MAPLDPAQVVRGQTVIAWAKRKFRWDRKSESIVMLNPDASRFQTVLMEATRRERVSWLEDEMMPRLPSVPVTVFDWNWPRCPVA
jgi:hypothetical protein